MRELIIRFAPEGIVKAAGLCYRAGRARYKFSAAVLLLIVPFRALARPRIERQPGSDLYVMF